MTESARFSPNPDKLAAAAAYLAQRSLGDDNFGETKLVKLLYYADCAAYLRTGRPITGTTYVRLDHGPYPDNWRAVKQSLEHAGTIRVSHEQIPNGYSRQRWLPGQSAAADSLTEQERKFLDEQLHRFAGFNARQIEEYSHDEVGWRVTDQGQAIPYNLAGLRIPPPPTAETRARAQRIADDIRKNGRQVANDVTPRF